MLTTLRFPRDDARPASSRGSTVSPAFAILKGLKIAAGSLALLLVAFHGALLLADVDAGRVFEPLVAARWATAALLFGAGVAFRRVGVPILWGRKAAVLWVLVLMLHGGARPPTLEATVGDSPGGSLVLVFLPVIAAGVASFALARRKSPGAHIRPDPGQLRFLPIRPSVRYPTPGFTLLLAARPPPAC